MLAFDHIPAAHFLSQQPLCRTPYPFNDINLFLDGMNFGPAAKRSSVSLQHRPRHQHHHRHHHHGIRDRQLHQQQFTSRSPSFADFFDLLDDNNHKATPEIYSDVLQTSGSYQLVFRKDNGSSDFSSYMIRYVAKNRHIDLVIESKDDEYKKVYRFMRSAIDIDGVKWKVIEDLLVVDVPKAGAVRKSSSISNGSTEKESDESQKSSLEGDKHEEPQPGAEVQTEISVTSDEPKLKSRVISIPIEFLESSENVLSRVSSSTEETTESSSCSSSTTSSDVDEENTKDKAKTSSDAGENIKETAIDKEDNSTDGEELTKKLTRSSSEESLESQPAPKMPRLAKKVIIEDVEDEAFIVHDLD